MACHGNHGIAMGFDAPAWHCHELSSPCMTLPQAHVQAHGSAALPWRRMGVMMLHGSTFRNLRRAWAFTIHELSWACMVLPSLRHASTTGFTALAWIVIALPWVYMTLPWLFMVLPRGFSWHCHVFSWRCHGLSWYRLP